MLGTLEGITIYYMHGGVIRSQYQPIRVLIIARYYYVTVNVRDWAYSR